MQKSRFLYVDESQLSDPLMDDFLLYEDKIIYLNLKERILKRTFDIVFSLVLLSIAFIPMIFIAMLLKVSSPKSKIILKQERSGRNGRVFTIYTFSKIINKCEHKYKCEHWIEYLLRKTSSIV